MYSKKPFSGQIILTIHLLLFYFFLQKKSNIRKTVKFKEIINKQFTGIQSPLELKLHNYVWKYKIFSFFYVI